MPHYRRRRRRARSNPVSNTTLYVVGAVGAVGLGLLIWQLTKPKALTQGGGGNGGSGGNGGGGGGNPPPLPPPPPPPNQDQQIYNAARSAYNSAYAANIGIGNEASASLAGFVAAVQAAIAAGARQTIDGVNVATQVTHDAFVANGKSDFAASLLAAAARTAAGLG